MEDCIGWIKESQEAMALNGKENEIMQHDVQMFFIKAECIVHVIFRSQPCLTFTVHLKHGETRMIAPTYLG